MEAKTFIIIILQAQFLGTQLAKKTLVEACQINSNTNQILQIISKKQRKRKEGICVINQKQERQICLMLPVKEAKV